MKDIPHGDPSSRAAVGMRVAETYAMIVRGLRRTEIIRKGREEYGWKVGDRTVDNYIAKATAQLESEAQIQHKAELGKAMARFDSLYATMIEREDFRGALKVQQAINDMLGLRSDRNDDVDAIDEWLRAMRGR